jgi:hypothetical protein
MLEDSVKWALIFFMVYTPNGNEQSFTHQRDDMNYFMLEECKTAGNAQLSIIDVPPGYSPDFACVPIEAIEGIPDITAPK